MDRDALGLYVSEVSLFALLVANALVDARLGIIVQSMNSCCYSLCGVVCVLQSSVNGDATDVQ